jgi:hypothetical protein
VRRPSIATSEPPAIASSTHGSTFPWGVLVAALVVGLIVYAIIRARRNAAVVPYSAAAGGPAAGGPAYGAQPGYGAPPMAPMGGGIGSGIVGGLVTGAAVGAGVVAGEALAHNLIDRHGSDRDLPASDRPAPAADNDLGGQDFGMSDSGSWDDGGSNFGMGGGGGDDWS